ncbi:MAG TPA: hypothetical protein DIU39_09015 [Flavobacteriales bacterium]|nr:hypothetical protein [Flavobacteriales bacterium]|tara:strand:+ start:9690 stop:10529 length:840 start_codon:yes stop_codon:yes gene_type:complete
MDEISELRQKITDLVDNIKEHSDRFTGKKHLPTLELNVFLAKLNRLYETTVVLRYLMEEKEGEKLSPFIESELSDAVYKQNPKERTNVNIPFPEESEPPAEKEENTTPELPQEETPIENSTQPEADNQEEIVQESTSEEITQEEIIEPKPEQPQEKKTQAEEENNPDLEQPQAIKQEENNISQASSSPTSNDQASLADKLSNKPITNLTQALSLNEKYLYANEFFNKDLNAFLLMVKRINEAQNLDEAMTIFKSEVAKAEDSENELTESFTKLIIRRFL